MKRLVIWILAVAAVCACSRDLGNYTYTDLEDPGISGFEDCSVLTFTDLKISPSFADGFDRNSCQYEWKAIDRNGSMTQTVLGNDCNLDYHVALSPGQYSLYFTVTEKETDLLLPFYEGELKFFFKDYKSYYYLKLRVSLTVFR